MAKITDYDRRTYQEKVKGYTTMTGALLKAEKDILLETRGKGEDAPMRKLDLVDEMLNLSSNYIAINGVSQIVLKSKNEEALNDGRKSLYKAVIYLEEIVSNFLDVPFSDYEDKLAVIGSFDENQRFQLIKKMGLAIDLLESAYGDNSKWKWTFVELEGRFATAAKNILDLREAVANRHPDSPYYDSTFYHIKLVKDLLARSAGRYRDKYELSTQQMSDFKTGINFLGALRRLHIVLSENEDAEAAKKKFSIWTHKLETDQKKQEDAKKKA